MSYRLTPCQKLEKMLSSHGFSNIRIRPALGYWRSSPYVDVYRWESWCSKDGLSASVSSYNTVTECVRNGFEICKIDGAGFYTFEAFAYGKSDKAKQLAQQDTNTQ